MDHQSDLVELEPDDLQQVAGMIGSDGERFGRVGVRFEIDNRDCVLEGVANRRVADAVPASRTVNLQIKSIL